MRFQKYEVALIPLDLRPEETIQQIADALQQVERITDDIFSRVRKRVAEQKIRIDSLNSRIDVAKAKVKKLTGSKKATTVFSSAKYPGPAENVDFIGLFDLVDVVNMYRSGNKIHAKHTTSMTNTLQERLQFYHVKLGNQTAFSEGEGLGRLPKDIGSVGSLLLFNTAENPYRKYVTLDPLGAKTKTRKVIEEEEDSGQLAAAPASILNPDEDDQPSRNYLYLPGLGEVPELNVPLALPDLPGVADDVEYDVDIGPAIAPSITSTPAIPDLPSFFPETPTINGELQPHAAVPPVLLPSLPPPPPPLPAPPPPLVPDSVTHSSVGEHTIAVAPLPPPLPDDKHDAKSNSDAPQGVPKAIGGNNAHSSLMAAIREAGGKAKLTAVQDRRIEAKKKKQEEKESRSSGGDLMADLHAKLALRRKGISGTVSSTENSTNSNRPVPTADSMLEKVASLIPPPPIQQVTTNVSADDSDDWD